MFHNQREAPIDFALVVSQAERLVPQSPMAHGMVSIAGSTTVHGEPERRSPSLRKKAYFGKLVVGTTKGEHDNLSINAESVLLVEQHGGPKTQQTKPAPIHRLDVLDGRRGDTHSTTGCTALSSFCATLISTEITA